MPQPIDSKTKFRICWSRRLINRWITRNAGALHLALGVIFLGLFAAGTLLSHTGTSDGAGPSLLPGRLRLAGFGCLFLLLLLALLHQNLHGTDHFLKQFRDTSNLPDGQLRQVSIFCMILFLAVSALSMAGASWCFSKIWPLITAWFSGHRNLTPPEPNALIIPDIDRSTPDLTAWAEQAGEAPSWLAALETLMYITAILFAAALVLFALYRLAHRIYTFLSCSRTWDDDEKLFIRPVLPYTAEDPKEEDSGSKRLFRFFHGPVSPRDAIRRHYRRTIRSGLSKQQQTAPSWASPAELEAAAACESPTLHQIYEKARYASAECTREDLDAIRRK